MALKSVFSRGGPLTALRDTLLFCQIVLTHDTINSKTHANERRRAMDIKKWVPWNWFKNGVSTAAGCRTG
jgi:hypothetical protein